MPRFTAKNECFPIYLLGNPINVCSNPQNRAHFSEAINLRGHMPGVMKKSVFPHLSSRTHHKCVLKPSEQGLFFQDNRI